MKKIAALAIILLWSNTAFAAEVAPGTRVVPVMQHAMEMNEIAPSVEGENVGTATAAVATTMGQANISKYITPEFDRTLGTDAAVTWTFGILGGDRNYLYAAPELFKIGPESPKPEKVNAFLALREQLYPATAWSIGNAQLLNIEKQPFGYKVSMLAVNVEPLIEDSYKKVSAKYPKLSGDARHVLAEWHVMYRLRDESAIEKLKHTTTERIAPVNGYGKIAFGPQSVNNLMSIPETLLTEIAKTFGDKTPKWAAPYMDSIKFILKYSGNLSVSPELKL